VQATALATAVGEYFCCAARGLPLARCFELAADVYGLDEIQTGQLLDEIQQRISDSADLFETDISTLGSPTELMSDAMEQLGRLATTAASGGADQQVRSQLLDENGRLKQRIQELVQRNAVDPLTSVFNRGHFDEQLRQQSAIARAARLPMGLLFIDADHFKSVNDTYGHAVGDVVLKRLAMILSQSIRGEDLVARYGGEEFVVLVSNPSEAAMAALGERVRIAVERERIPVDRATIRVTVSIGGSLATPPLDESTAEQLLAVADAALYSAKEGGRNQVRIQVIGREAADFVLATPTVPVSA
jgi:diguanylate cyclase (GGDEF)-like protein